MINALREVICVILGLSIGLLFGFFIYPIMYHKYLEKEGLIKNKEHFTKCVKPVVEDKE